MGFFSAEELYLYWLDCGTWLHNTKFTLSILTRILQTNFRHLYLKKNTFKSFYETKARIVLGLLKNNSYCFSLQLQPCKAFSSGIDPRRLKSFSSKTEQHTRQRHVLIVIWWWRSAVASQWLRPSCISETFNLHLEATRTRSTNVDHTRKHDSHHKK